MKANTETGRMRTVKVIVAEVKEIQIPEEVYQNGQYNNPPTAWTEERWEQWWDAIVNIGRKVGYELLPEDGCEWFSEQYIKEGIFNGVIAILNEQNEIMAQAGEEK